MLDINLIRDEPERVRQSMLARQMDPAPVDQILALDLERRKILSEVETLKAERNQVSKEIGRSKDAAERQDKIEAMRRVGDQITALEERLRQVEPELDAALAIIPNLPDPRVPVGKDDHDNVVVRTVGKLPQFDFTPKAHWDLGPALGILNFNHGVKITGSRFYVLSGA